MVNRWVALLLAVLGGAVAAYAIALMFGGALVGVLWLFVFGDDPWPGWVEPLASLVIVAGALLTWTIVGRQIWDNLRRR